MIWYEWENVYEYIVGGCCRNHHIHLHLRYTRNPITHTTHTRTLAIAFYPIDVARAQAFLISSLTLGWFLHRYATTMEKWWFVLSHESKFHRDSITCFINKLRAQIKREKISSDLWVKNWRLHCWLWNEAYISGLSSCTHPHRIHICTCNSRVLYTSFYAANAAEASERVNRNKTEKRKRPLFECLHFSLRCDYIFCFMCIYSFLSTVCVCVCHRCSLAMATQRSTETRQTKRHSMHQCQSLLCLFSVHHVRINVALRRSNGWE